MTQLLYLLVLAMLAFLLLLVLYDATPKTLLLKVISRVLGTERVETILRAEMSDAPYRRFSGAPGRLHRPVLLNLTTSEGSGQAVHPDVAYVAEGFGSKKWPYWMACTPYPYGSDRHENPELFVSRDGIAWETPEDASNPLVPSPSKAPDHNSDPDILFHDQHLWLFFRRTRRSTTPVENTLFVMKSPDGVLWSTPVAILRETVGSELLSPAVVHDGKLFRMWTVEKDAGKFALMHRTSTDGILWSAPAKNTVIGLDDGRNVWHVDVIREQDRFSALFVTSLGDGGRAARLHYGYSLDEGSTWVIGPFLFDQIYEFERGFQYRGTFRRFLDDPPSYELWYSAKSRSSVMSIAYLRVVRDANQLHPLP